MRTFALASGSSGNCYYIESNLGVKILVDLGLSFKRTKEILYERGINIKDIDYVFITHEHSDHCQGLVNFTKNVDSKIYISKGTFSNLNCEWENYEIVKNHSLIQLDDIKVFVVSKPHDSKEAVSFVFEGDGKKIGIFTDLGYATDEIKYILKTLDIIYFEANYSKEIIAKQKNSFANNYIARSISDEGHLDLDECCNILESVVNDNQKIILSHISENTNSYELTYNTVKSRLSKLNKFPQILISFQKEPTQWIE
jgi:phosphoribosyl 1,2-cyclic phosphodiesterase